MFLSQARLPAEVLHKLWLALTVPKVFSSSSDTSFLRPFSLSGTGRGRGRAGDYQRAGGSWGERSKQARARDSSVVIAPDWELKNEIALSALAKQHYDMEKLGEPQDM